MIRRAIHRLQSTPRLLSLAIETQKGLMGELFWRAWEPLPFHKKLTWLAFVSQTVGVFTLLQLLAMRR